MPIKDPEKRRAYNAHYRDQNREKRQAYHRELYAKHREDVLAKQRTWYANNKERRKTWDRKKWRASKEKLLKRYGLTLLEYYMLLEQQGYRCPICSDWLRPEGGDLHIDHCHKTGKVRGILHDACNRFLGFAHDDMTFLANAIDYLNKAQAL